MNEIASPARIQAPPPPGSLEETGLSATLMVDILLKTMFRMSLNRVTDMSRLVCLSFAQVQELIDMARAEQLVEAMGTLASDGGTPSEMGFRLTDAGRRRAEQALAVSEYYGAMPVPLDHYGEQVRRQSIRKLKITRDQLLAAMGDLILPEGLLADLGPAVTSGRSILMYGPPGNGKSSISNGIRDALGDNVFVPHAVVHAGQVISVYDPIVHRRIAAPEARGSQLRLHAQRHDPRYILCERPTVITGGELRLEMLDLKYNTASRTYQAPLQFKAMGGVFIVDDLGRQEEPPQALVNRWIVPLEMNYDILSLASGEKFIVPFDTLVIFSTNFHPNTIFDQAALRRIFFKIKIDGPTQADFLKIFALVARKRRVPLNEDALIHLLQTKYPTIDNVYANYQPVFLIDQMIAICEFEGKPYHMSPELIDRAWSNMFVKDEAIVR